MKLRTIFSGLTGFSGLRSTLIVPAQLMISGQPNQLELTGRAPKPRGFWVGLAQTYLGNLHVS